MSNRKKEIKDRAVIIELLNTCHTGRLGTVGKDGYPMVKPLNFVHHEGKIYFHTAKEGEKIDDIKRDSRVCFEVDLPIAYVRAKNQPCEAEYLYRSVIIKGSAHIVEDSEEKLFALKCLMEKYQPEANYGEFPEEKLAITGIVGIDIEEMTGKEDLGKGILKDAVLKALRDRVQLPIVLD
ncbi:MAG TPA: pyridoxamine 5'-phosphate oxidase family protein [Nitrospirae bacterium]|nr:pyridoxamine 5'-phosphate oxidase family protein [Nitrospirota bacterium]